MDDGVAGADGEEGGMLAADKATWHKWLSKRESEASREPSTAATLLCAAKLPQMVSEMLKCPDLPPLLTRKLVGLLAQPSVRRAPNVERTDALYRLLLNSALMNGAPPPEVDPTDEAAAEAAAAAAAERGGAAAEVRPPIIAYIEALPTLSRQAAGGGGGGGGGAVVSEFLNLLRELHARYGSEADAHALLASLVQPLRAAARGVNLTMAVEEAVDDLLEKLSEPLAADANGGANGGANGSGAKEEEPRTFAQALEAPPPEPEPEAAPLNINWGAKPSAANWADSDDDDDEVDFSRLGAKEGEVVAAVPKAVEVKEEEDVATYTHADDWRSLPVFPTHRDLSGSALQLPRGMSRGTYDSAEDCLMANFLLLREDVVAPLRSGIQALRDGTLHDRDRCTCTLMWSSSVCR